jgi:hypothetical protein
MEKKSEIKIEIGDVNKVKISKLEEDIKTIETKKKSEKVIVPNKGKK